MWLTHDADELNESIRENNRDMVRFHQIVTSAQFNADVKDSQGYTPQIVACQEGCLGLVDQLLGFGADVNRRDNAGWTVCMHAIVNDRMDVQYRQQLVPEQDLFKLAFNAETNQIQTVALQRRANGKSLSHVEYEGLLPKRLPCASKVHPCAYYPQGMNILGLAAAQKDASYLELLLRPLKRQNKEYKGYPNVFSYDKQAICTLHTQKHVILSSQNTWRVLHQLHVQQDTVFSSLFHPTKVFPARIHAISKDIGEYGRNTVYAMIDGVSRIPLKNTNIEDMDTNKKSEYVLLRSFLARYLIQQLTREYKNRPFLPHFSLPSSNCYVNTEYTALHIACMHGNSLNVDLQCAHGHPFVSIKDTSPLDQAIQYNHWDCVTILSKYFNLHNPAQRNTPFHKCLNLLYKSTDIPAIPLLWSNTYANIDTSLDIGTYLYNTYKLDCKYCSHTICTKCISMIRTFSITHVVSSDTPTSIQLFLAISKGTCTRKQASRNRHTTQWFGSMVALVTNIVYPALTSPSICTTGNTYFPVYTFIQNISQWDMVQLDTSYQLGTGNRVLTSSQYLAQMGDTPVYGHRTKLQRPLEYSNVPLLVLRSACVYTYLQFHRYSMHVQALLFRKQQLLKKQEHDLIVEMSKEVDIDGQARNLRFSTDAQEDADGLPTVLPLSISVSANLQPGTDMLDIILSQYSPQTHHAMGCLAIAMQGKAQALHHEYLRAVPTVSLVQRNNSKSSSFIFSTQQQITASTCPQCHPLFQFIRLGQEEPNNDTELLTLLFEIGILSRIIGKCITCTWLRELCGPGDWQHAKTRAGYTVAVEFMAKYKCIQITKTAPEIDYTAKLSSQNQVVLETLLHTQASLHVLNECILEIQRNSSLMLQNLNLVIQAWNASTEVEVHLSTSPHVENPQYSKFLALKSSYEYIYDTWYSIHTNTLNSGNLQMKQYIIDKTVPVDSAAHRSSSGQFDKLGSESLFATFKKKEQTNSVQITDMLVQVHDDKVYKENYDTLVKKENDMQVLFTSLDDVYTEIMRNSGHLDEEVVEEEEEEKEEDVQNDSLQMPMVLDFPQHDWTDYFDDSIPSNSDNDTEEEEEEYRTRVQVKYDAILMEKQKHRELLRLQREAEMKAMHLREKELLRLQSITEEEEKVRLQRKQERKLMQEEGKVIDNMDANTNVHKVHDMNALEVKLAWAAEENNGNVWDAVVEGEVLDGKGKRRRRRGKNQTKDIIQDVDNNINIQQDIITNEALGMDNIEVENTNMVYKSTIQHADAATYQNVVPDGMDEELLAVIGPLEPSRSPLPEPPMQEEEEEDLVAVRRVIQRKELFFGTDTSFFNDTGFFLSPEDAVVSSSSNGSDKILNTYELKQQKEQHKNIELLFDNQMMSLPSVQIPPLTPVPIPSDTSSEILYDNTTITKPILTSITSVITIDDIYAVLLPEEIAVLTDFSISDLKELDHND